MQEASERLSDDSIRKMTAEGETRDSQGNPPGVRAILNVSRWTLALGFLGAGVAYLLQRSDWAAGIACGTVLGWLDFRWLRRGVVSMLSSAAETAPRARRSAGFSAFLALFRYILIGLIGYAIFEYLHVPIVSIVVGLCALGVATIAASVWEILNPAK